MTLQFPIPQFIGEAVRYEGGTWVWDGVGWHVDQTANRLDLAAIPAYLGQFTHVLPSVPPLPTFISLATPDIYGATFVLANAPPLQGIKVYKNGELLVMAGGVGVPGDYVVNRAANRIEFLNPLVVNDVITIGVLTPSDALAPGRVDVREIKDLDTDWVTNPANPTTGMVNGVRRTFDLLVDIPGVGQQFAVIGDDIELAVFVNGIRQRPTIDYITVGSRVTMTVAPVAGVPFWALWYLPAGAGSGGGVSPPQPPLDARLAFYGSRPGSGVGWQDARGLALTVPNTAARLALRPDIDIFAGSLVAQADQGGTLWIWTGTAWARYLDAGTFTARLGGATQILRSTTALQRPAAASLLAGQFWVNMADRVFGFGDGAGNPIELLPRVAASAGAADAGKLPALGASGVLDQSFFLAGMQPYGTVNPGSIGLVDWNNAHLNGTTVVRAAAGTPNRPPGPDLPYAGHYISMGDANTGVLTALSPLGDTVYVRPRSLGAWGNWIQVNSPGLDISSAMLRANNLNDVNSKPVGRTNLEVMFNPRTVFAGDLNLLDETGLYPLGIGVTNGWTNDGTGAGGEATVGDAVLHIETGGALAYQMGFNVIPTGPAAKPLRMRFMTGPTTWTPWASVSTSDEVTTQINAAIAAAIAALPPGTAFIGPAAPPTPVAGQFWYNTTAMGLFVYRTDTDPDRWEQSWPDPPPGTFIGDTPPPSPAAGQLWFKTVNPVGLYIWYTDVDSSQWVSVGGGGGSGGGDTTPTEIVGSGLPSANWQVVGDMLIQWGITRINAIPQNLTLPKAFKTLPVATGSTDNSTDVNVTVWPDRVDRLVLRAFIQTGAAAPLGLDVYWIAVGEALDADKMPKEVQIPGGGGGGGSGGVPIGAVSFFAANSVPSGWLICNNQRVTTAYPDLRQYLLDAGSPYGEVGGDPRVPELRGEFIRSFDGGRGVDPGRVFGSAQDDEFEAHVHGPVGDGAFARLPPGGTGGTFGVVAGTVGAAMNNTGSAGGTETRPRNVALLACIKAFSETLVEGQANFGIATDPEVRAGARNDAVLTPANVRALSGLIVPPATLVGTTGYTFTGIPPEAAEIELGFNGLALPAVGSFDMTVNDLVTGYLCLQSWLAAGVGTTEHLTAIRMQTASLNGAFSGAIRLSRGVGCWTVGGEAHQLSSTRQQSVFAGRVDIAGGQNNPITSLKLLASANISGGEAWLRWRI